MTEDTRAVLKLMAGLLDYPGSEGFWTRVAQWLDVAEEVDPELGRIMHHFLVLDRITLEKLYVETFDFDSKAGLYITAHELGDSRNRGEALIELTNLYHEAGYEVPDDQLADYLPVLLELLALRPESIPPTVVDRVAKVGYNIAQHLDLDHPYRPLFIVLHRALGAPMAAPPTAEEHPDLTDLPYPIEYQ